MSRILKLIKLNIKLLRKEIFILILQFLLMLMLIRSVIPKYRIENETYNIYKNSSLSKSILYYNDIESMEVDIFEPDSKSNKIILERLKSNLNKLESLTNQNKNVISTSPNIDKYYFELKDSNHTAEVIEKEILDIYLKNKIEVISNEEKDNDAIQAYIVLNDGLKGEYNLGDIYKTKISNNLEDQSKNSTDVKIQIAGFLSNDIFNFISRSVYAEGVASLDLIFKDNLVADNEYIFFEYSDILKSIDSIENMTSFNTFSKFIYFDENTTDEQIIEFNNKIKSSNIGNSNTSIDMMKSQSSIIKSILRDLIDKIFLTLILVLTTLVVSIYVNSNKIKKVNNIFNLHGVRKSETLIANYLTNLIPYIIVFLPYTIKTIIRNSKLYIKLRNDSLIFETRRVLNIREIFIISIIIMSIIFIFTILPYFNLKKDNINNKKVGN